MIYSVCITQTLWWELDKHIPAHEFFCLLEAKFMWIDLPLDELVIHFIAMTTKRDLAWHQQARDSYLSRDRKRFQVSVYFLGKQELATDLVEDRIKAEVKRLMLARKVAKETDFPDWYDTRWWKGSLPGQ